MLTPFWVPPIEKPTPTLALLLLPPVFWLAVLCWAASRMLRPAARAEPATTMLH